MRPHELGSRFPAFRSLFYKADKRRQRLLAGLGAAILAAGLAGPLAPLSAEEDPRATVSLPADVAAAFLAEMRTHMANLDDVVAALAEGDFKAAASIAELQMTQGHHRWAAMAEQGASDEEIAAAKEQFKTMRDARGGQMGKGQGMGKGRGMGGGGMGMGPGFGRYMPEDFRAMGDSFHEAAESFATSARSVATPATPTDYRSVLEGLQEVTTTCRACHDAFRVEVAK